MEQSLSLNLGKPCFEARVAACHELFIDDNDQIVKDMLAGQIEPSAANVAITWNKWKALNG